MPRTFDKRIDKKFNCESPAGQAGKVQPLKEIFGREQFKIQSNRICRSKRKPVQNFHVRKGISDLIAAFIVRYPIKIDGAKMYGAKQVVKLLLFPDVAPQ